MISIATSMATISPPSTAATSATASATRSASSLSLFYNADFKSSFSSLAVSFSSVIVNPFNFSIRRSRRIANEIVIRSDSDTSSSATAVSASTTTALSEEETDEIAAAKIGARLRVKVPLKVYHVAKLPELDLFGMEGVMKDYVCLWKGKRISANLPFKVEFVTNVEDRPPIKFVVHLKEDEFEFV